MAKKRPKALSPLLLPGAGPRETRVAFPRAQMSLLSLPGVPGAEDQGLGRRAAVRNEGP